MVRIIFFIFFICLLFSYKIKSQWQNLEIKNINGEIVSLKNILREDKTIILSFFATWCSPCIKELNTLNEVYEKWKEDYNVDIIAISIDDSKSVSRVKPLVKTKGWTFPVYLDINSDVKRAFNVINLPHIIILKKGKIVYQHTTYYEGFEDFLLEKIREEK